METAGTLLNKKGLFWRQRGGSNEIRWPLWFAWYPKRLRCGKLVWLQWVNTTPTAYQQVWFFEENPT